MNYILLTAARNEEKNIEKTIQSVLGQTIKPVQWIIISDGSTDKTDDIVISYSRDNSFIKFFRASGTQEYNFGSKVKAINFAKNQIDIKKYDYIGILDADISFNHNYFEELMNRIEKNNNLGIAGGIICEVFNNKIFKQKISSNSVAGAVQFFRRICFEQLGDFIPLPHGGEDAVMEIVARMKSWDVKTFPDMHVMHYGYVGHKSGGIFKAKYNRGIRFYHLGYHPLFQIIRSLYRITDWPYVAGSISELYGFFHCYVKKEKIMLPDDIIKFLRKEQLQRLNFLKRF